MPGSNVPCQNLTEALRLIVDSKWASVADLAQWGGVSVQTIYRWIGEDSSGASASWQQVQMIAQCGVEIDSRIPLALVGAFAFNTRLRITADDVDGVLAHKQAVVAKSLDAVKEAAEFAADVNTSLNDGHISVTEITRIRSDADDAKGAIDAAVHGAEKIAADHQKRS